MLPFNTTLACAENESGQSSLSIKRPNSDGVVKVLAADTNNEDEQPTLSMSFEMIDQEGIVLLNTAKDELEVCDR